MKQQFILWLAAVLIVFLAGYMRNVTGGYYPVTGTFSINGEKTTYMLDKISYGSPYNVVIRTDSKDIKGILRWNSTGGWQQKEMKAGKDVLYAGLPGSIGEKIVYSVTLSKGIGTKKLPETTILFLGKVSKGIWGLYFFLLYGALLLGMRGGLDYFNDKGKPAMYSIFTVIFFGLYSFMINPIKKTYEAGGFNHTVLNAGQIFDAQSLLFFFIWFAAMIAAFKAKQNKLFVLSAAVITLIIFIVM